MANTHYNPRWRHRKPALSSVLFQNNARAAGYKYLYSSEFYFLLTLQVATSSYEIKLRDSVWSRTHIRDQVNVRPRMELVLLYNIVLLPRLSSTLFALADPYMRILITGASLGFCCKLPSSLAESQFCR